MDEVIKENEQYNVSDIENYARSLVNNGVYTSLGRARSESVRWHKKALRGNIEPMKCPLENDHGIRIRFEKRT